MEGPGGGGAGASSIEADSEPSPGGECTMDSARDERVHSDGTSVAPSHESHDSPLGGEGGRGVSAALVVGDGGASGNGVLGVGGVLTISFACGSHLRQWAAYD